MKASATDTANDRKRHGKNARAVRRNVGVSGQELLRRLRFLRFTDAERAQLTKAMEDGAKALSHAGRD